MGIEMAPAARREGSASRSAGRSAKLMSMSIDAFAASSYGAEAARSNEARLAAGAAPAKAGNGG